MGDMHHEADIAGLEAWGITRTACETGRHRTHLLQAGPPDGPAIVFVHGWPGLARSWRHQLKALGAAGYRVIAPDLRGCGRSSRPAPPAAYGQAEIVADMIELIDALGVERAVWVGHDWGSVVVWNLASHHPDRCLALSSLCVPYLTLDLGIDSVTGLLNRDEYPQEAYPYGQFEYYRYYAENLSEATRTFEADLGATFRTIMRRGERGPATAPYPTALVRRQGGWFGGAGRAPDVPRDAGVLMPEDLDALVAAYSVTGFSGVNALYLNDADNLRYTQTRVNGGRLSMPVLFLSGRYDRVNDNEGTRLTEPMRAHCEDLTIAPIESGHWMQEEAPAAVNSALASWLEDKGVAPAHGDHSEPITA